MPRLKCDERWQQNGMTQSKIEQSYWWAIKLLLFLNKPLHCKLMRLSFSAASIYHAVIYHFLCNLWITGFTTPIHPAKRTIRYPRLWRQNFLSWFYFETTPPTLFLNPDFWNDSSHSISRSWFLIRIEAIYVLFKLMFYE